MSDDQDVRRREELVRGDGPRIAPMQVEEFSDEALEITRRMMRAASNADGKPSLEGVPEIIPTMLRHPELFRRLTDFSLQLLGNGVLSARDREILILRIAWLSGAPYEWGEHVEIAKKAGVAAEEVERVTLGSTADGWSRHDRALLRAVEELHGDAMISDATWDTLAECFDEKQLIELPILVGQYQAVAYFQNSLRLRLQPGNPGLRAR